MSDDLNKSLEDRLRDLAVKKAVPFLKGETPYPKDAKDDVAGSITLTLWDYGYLQAADDLISQGVPIEDVHRELEKARPTARGAQTVEYELSEPLARRLEAELAQAWHDDDATELLTERTSKAVKEFKAVFRSNESQHRGRPHVVAVLRGLEVSISLDDPPEVLAPKGKIRGVAAALRVIQENRGSLLKEWDESRPDDQKL